MKWRKTWPTGRRHQGMESPWDCTYQLQKIQLDHSWHRRMRKDKLFLTATWVALSGQEKNDTPTEKMCLWNRGTISQRSSFGIIFDRGKRHVSKLCFWMYVSIPFIKGRIGKWVFSFPCTNNVADYEALLIGLELAAAMGMQSIHVQKGSSRLVVRSFFE